MSSQHHFVGMGDRVNIGRNDELNVMCPFFENQHFNFVLRTKYEYMLCTLFCFVHISKVMVVQIFLVWSKFSLDYFNLIINFMHKLYICHVKQICGLWQIMSPCIHLKLFLSLINSELITMNCTSCDDRTLVK